MLSVGGLANTSLKFSDEGDNLPENNFRMIFNGSSDGRVGFRKLARLVPFLMMVVFQAGSLLGQEFLIINSNRELFSVDIDNCAIQYVASVQIAGGGSISDITYTDDGRLWGITTDGRLYTIAESSGATSLEYTLPNNNAPFFTSLVADGEGRIYAAGGSGDLYVLDINTMQHSYLGDIGYGAAGDLTFYQGQLIMASTTNQMIDVDLDNPSNSSVRLNFNAGGQIFGIVTFVEDCDNTATYATNDAGNGVVLQVDFDSGQLNQVCALGTRIFGAASLLEFLAANPIEVIAANTTPTTCASPQGRIELLAAGGNGPLSYSLDNISFQSNGTFTGLPPGDYTVYVQDGQGCTARQMATVEAIGDAPGITAAMVQADSCGAGVGAITVEAGGGVPPYQYGLNGGAAVDSPQFAGLAGGVYEIRVVDSQGCSAVQTATIPGQPGPQIERIGIKACGPGQNTLSVDAGGGTGGLLYSLDGGAGQADPEFAGLDAGLLLVSVIDEAGCSDIETVDIPLAESLEITGVDALACGPENSSLAVAATGGSGPLAYSLNGGPPRSSGYFENLSPGTYALMVTDDNGCTAARPASIPEYDPPRISKVEVAPSRCGTLNGAVRVETSGGTGPFLYVLNGVEQPEPEFTGLAPGLFQLSVLDAEGCSAVDSVTVGQSCPIYIPNAFSPNDDGRNDRFGLYSGAEVQVLYFGIFNRWGGLVYDQSNFSSRDRARFWDGRFGEEPAPVGVYAFYVEVVNASGEEECYKGEVLLVR